MTGEQMEELLAKDSNAIVQTKMAEICPKRGPNGQLWAAREPTGFLVMLGDGRVFWRDVNSDEYREI